MFSSLLAATGGEVVCFLIFVAVCFVIGVSSIGASSPASQSRSGYSPPAPPRPPAQEIPEFMVRGQMKSVGEGEEKMQCIEVQFRGRIPVTYSQEVGILVTVEDATGGSSHPVYAVIKQLADPETRRYRQFRRIGTVSMGTFAPEWGMLTLIPIGLLQTPYSGTRRLRISCRCIPSSFENVPFGDDRLKYGVICDAQTFYSANIPLTGYLEVVEKRREGMVASVELALACACADGTVDQRELRVIHRWMSASVAERSDDSADEQAKLKSQLNEAMKAGVRGGGDIHAISTRIRKLSLPGVSQAALSLCVEVIAADGELHAKELETVRGIARDLGLDYDQLQSLLDKQFVNASVTSAQENLEAIVGIDPAWDKERIRKHLSEQFMKWNGRAPAAKTVEDQARIRLMLEAVAKLRKKYS